MIESTVRWLLNVLAIPDVGLSSVFIISVLSATLLPLGSEPAVFAVAKANAALFWPVILVATIGNTLGGVIDYLIGYGAKQTFTDKAEGRWFRWMQRFGPKTLLLSWLPGVGDPLCALAGWLRMPFWQSVLFMSIGKFLRYLTMTSALLYIPDGFWQELGNLF
ncbi:YqaA family protein [Noviherbaspirillum saxi]|uniref:DedA family protein n=1 Tax=Noviherbaspirillum saxi TaxID=2320863 RepID=A0A3A3FR12_9BURK|nr:YqaA family protein [Noviherbaspirillum saxi]RJF97674.1 DedA family protein [Noviherbaspirillum saxi]